MLELMSRLFPQPRAATYENWGLLAAGGGGALITGNKVCHWKMFPELIPFFGALSECTDKQILVYYNKNK